MKTTTHVLGSSLRCSIGLEPMHEDANCLSISTHTQSSNKVPFDLEEGSVSREFAERLAPGNDTEAAPRETQEYDCLNKTLPK